MPFESYSVPGDPVTAAFALYGTVVFGGFVAGAVIFYRRVHRRMVEERNRTPLLELFGRGRVDHFNTPFIRMSVYDDMIVVASLRSVLIPRSCVTSVKSYQHFGQEGARITYRSEGGASEVTFVAADGARVARAIAASLNLQPIPAGSAEKVV